MTCLLLQVAAALGAGCCIVLKPSELSPFTALDLAKLAVDECGLPPGVLNVVCGLGLDAGAPLSSHPDIAKVCFTGSVATGQAVMRACAAGVRNVDLELGDKSPIIVFDDVDVSAPAQLDAAAGCAPAAPRGGGLTEAARGRRWTRRSSGSCSASSGPTGRRVRARITSGPAVACSPALSPHRPQCWRCSRGAAGDPGSKQKFDGFREAMETFAALLVSQRAVCGVRRKRLATGCDSAAMPAPPLRPTSRISNRLCRLPHCARRPPPADLRRDLARADPRERRPQGLRPPRRGRGHRRGVRPARPGEGHRLHRGAM